MCYMNVLSAICFLVSVIEMFQLSGKTKEKYFKYDINEYLQVGFAITGVNEDIQNYRERNLRLLLRIKLNSR